MEKTKNIDEIHRKIEKLQKQKEKMEQQKKQDQIKKKIETTETEKKKPFKEYEINMLLDNDVIDCFMVEYGLKTFKYNGKTYNINDKAIYLLPQTEKQENYIPMLFYNINNPDPIFIKNNNIGIPARALYLLWNHALYSVIVTFETDKSNKLIILLLIANAILFCIKLYFTYGSS